MGKLKEQHKRRVEQVKTFAGKNKLFSIIACVIVIILIGNFFFSKVNKDTATTESETNQSETIEIVEESEEPLQWRFYWIDLWILLGAGGFCSVMILKERKKVREKL